MKQNNRTMSVIDVIIVPRHSVRFHPIPLPLPLLLLNIRIHPFCLSLLSSIFLFYTEKQNIYFSIIVELNQLADSLPPATTSRHLIPILTTSFPASQIPSQRWHPFHPSPEQRPVLLGYRIAACSGRRSSM